MDRPLANHARVHPTGYVDGKEPHALSLKVLRLTRPSLSTQNTLPTPSPTSTLAHSLPRSSSLAYPSAPYDSFSLTPLLTLPPEFGNAYVGETFSCTLCANNEFRESDTPIHRVHGVKIEAEMKTPTTVVVVPVAFANDPVASAHTSATTSRPTSANSTHDDPLRASSPAAPISIPTTAGVELAPGQSLQGIINYHLREDGPHVLSVTISYTSSTSTSGRVRSFRKLYQFVATPALVVRTKIGAIGGAPKAGAGIRASGARDSVMSMDGTPIPPQRRKWEGWALEAQLENVCEDGVVLEDVEFVTDDWCRATSLSDAWSSQRPRDSREGEDENGEGGTKGKHILSRGSVHQACFFVERVEGKEQDGKLYMGVLNIRWRGPMGNLGELSTGWLGLRR